MGTPRKASVSLTIGNSTADVTGDIISFNFEDSNSMVGQTLEVSLDNLSGLYSSFSGFVANGTQIVATITTANFANPGDNNQRVLAPMWIDVGEYDLKPSTVTFKATSVSPDMRQGELHHLGFEGQSLNDIYGTQGQILDADVMNGNTGGANDGSVTTGDGNTDLMRVDTDNQSYLKAMRTQAQDQGNEIMVVGGNIWVYNELEMESQRATLTLTVGSSSIIRGKLIWNAIDKYASAAVNHVDPKAGTLTKGSHTPSAGQAPVGVKSQLNIRKRPFYKGQNDNEPALSVAAIGQGQSGNPFDEEA
jgi:hypothetical protein